MHTAFERAKSALAVGASTALALATVWLLVVPDYPAVMAIGAGAATPGQARTDESAPFFATVRAMVGADETVSAQEYPTSPPPTKSRVGEPLAPSFPAGVLANEAAIQNAAKALNMDPFALASIQAAECPSGNAACLSGVGARGHFQVMPGTAVSIEASTGYPCTTMPFDPTTSALCGGWYFLECLKMASALWTPESEVAMIGMAAMGYNAGPGKISQYMPSADTSMGQGVCYITQIEETKQHCLNTTNAWLASGRR